MQYRCFLDTTITVSFAWLPGQSQQTCKVCLCSVFSIGAAQAAPCHHKCSLVYSWHHTISKHVIHLNIAADAAVYRLLTSPFVHAGLLHVAFNMLAFVPIGTSLERIQGTLALTHLISLLIVMGGAAYVSLATAASYIPWRYSECKVTGLPACYCRRSHYCDPLFNEQTQDSFRAYSLHCASGFACSNCCLSKFTCRTAIVQKHVCIGPDKARHLPPVIAASRLMLVRALNNIYQTQSMLHADSSCCMQHRHQDFLPVRNWVFRRGLWADCG